MLMSYVEVSGTRGYSTPLNGLAAPLNTLSDIYGVSWFKIPLSIGAMVSFFGLSLSCLNAGSRIIYPMARHGIFSGHLGKAHTTNRTPHVAISVYMILIFAVPTVLEIFTNPLTTFGDAGTLAAFGFLLAYFLITMAAPVYLKKIGELRPGHIVLAVVALLCLMVPTIGSFYPLPPYPVRLFPYIFLGWMIIGAAWLYVVSRRTPGILRRHRDRSRAGPGARRRGHRHPRLGGRGGVGCRRLTGARKGQRRLTTADSRDRMAGTVMGASAARVGIKAGMRRPTNGWESRADGVLTTRRDVGVRWRLRSQGSGGPSVMRSRGVLSSAAPGDRIPKHSE